MQSGLERSWRGRYEPLDRIVDALLDAWPEHQKFLDRSFRDRDEGMLESSNRIAQLVLELGGDERGALCDDYRWTCDRLQEEEIDFRRTGRYRRTSFAEVEREIYGRGDFMGRYINGLLLSQVIWFNHAAVLDFYIRRFLPETPVGGRLLEVGPGHGLMLCLAAATGRMTSLTGWDISPTSIEATRAAVLRMKVSQPVDLAVNDILQPQGEACRFDVVTMCEVLEHLEKP